MNWKPEWSKVRVSVSRKKRNARGWHVVILGEPVWFKHKSEATEALRRTIEKLRFEIRPVANDEPVSTKIPRVIFRSMEEMFAEKYGDKAEEEKGD